MTADVHGMQFGFDDQGDGLPVVLLHGFPHDRSLWTQQRLALASRVRCLVPDLRGFGESSAQAPFTMDQYADDVVALLDRLEVPRAVIGGLSMGGYVAMAMWRRHPHRVAGLVLCDTKATADTEDGRRARDDAMRAIRSDGTAAFAERQLAKMVGATTRARRPEIVDLMRTMMARQSPAAMIGALEALRDRPDSRQTLGTITVPTLVIVGEEDELTPPSDARVMLELLPASTNARLELIASAGHAACVERPAAVTFALTDFLATQSFDRE